MASAVIISQGKRCIESEFFKPGLYQLYHLFLVVMPFRNMTKNKDLIFPWEVPFTLDIDQ